MRCFEFIDDYPRSWNKGTHPIIAHLQIEAQQFSEFDRMAADQTQIRILGHDESDHGLIVIHIACTTNDAKRRIEKRWE